MAKQTIQAGDIITTGTERCFSAWDQYIALVKVDYDDAEEVYVPVLKGKMPLGMNLQCVWVDSKERTIHFKVV